MKEEYQMRLVDDFGHTVFSNIDQAATGWGKAIELKYKVEELEKEIKRLEGKVKFLEAWKDAEGKAYGRLLETSLRALEA